MQGDEEKRLIYGEVPDDARSMLGLKEDEIVRIRKAGYGLVNAPYRWFKKVEETLKELGWKQHPLDVCLFTNYDNNTDNICGIMGVYVDGVLTCAKDMHITKILMPCPRSSSGDTGTKMILLIAVFT